MKSSVKQITITIKKMLLKFRPGKTIHPNHENINQDRE